MRIPHLYNWLRSLRTRLHTFLIAKRDNVSIGRGSWVYYKCNVLNISKMGGVIRIGQNSLIGRSSKGYHAGMPFYTTILNDGENSSIVIGNNCRINGAYIHAQSSISIGNNCVIASGVNIIDSNGHQVKSLNRTTGRDDPMPIIIGDNVWIGINAIVLKGTELGDNCVVAAGSVVKGKYAPDSIIHPPVSLSEVINLE